MLQLPTAETFFGPRLRRSLGQQVLASDELHGDGRWLTLAEETGVPIALWANHLYGDSLIAPTVETDEASPVIVHVRAGRWVVLCECGSLQHAPQVDPRFLCVNCGNSLTAGRYRPIVWPEQPHQIEHALLERAAGPANRRHWLPHETVSDLVAQNLLLEAMTAA